MVCKGRSRPRICFLCLQKQSFWIVYKMEKSHFGLFTRTVHFLPIHSKLAWVYCELSHVSIKNNLRFQILTWRHKSCWDFQIYFWVSKIWIKILSPWDLILSSGLETSGLLIKISYHTVYMGLQTEQTCQTQRLKGF